MKIIIIGGGFIGLSCAYFCQEAGHEVIVVDKGNFTDGCSFGNAGIIEVSQMMPIPSPEMIKNAFKWMLNPKSPFYIEPRLDLDLYKWAWLFTRAAFKADPNEYLPVYKKLADLNKSLYQEILPNILSVPLSQKGLLIVYKTPKAQEMEAITAEQVASFGIKTKQLSKNKVQSLNPGIELDILGAMHYLDDMHVTSPKLMNSLKQYLESKQVQFIEGQAITGFETDGKIINSIKTGKSELMADSYVLASGIWSSDLAKQMGINMPMQAGKGYHIKTYPRKLTQIPMILAETKIAITPMQKELRFAGTMELSGINDKKRQARIKAIIEGAGRYLPSYQDISYKLEDTWCGLRPLSPDDKPYLGRVKKYDNLLVATGHGMRGMSLGLASGKLISDLIEEKSLDVELKQLAPDRYDT